MPGLGCENTNPRHHTDKGVATNTTTLLKLVNQPDLLPYLEHIEEISLRIAKGEAVEIALLEKLPREKIRFLSYNGMSLEELREVMNN